MIRVGFILALPGQAWLGGVSYFRNLLGALHDLPDRRIEPVLITERDTPDALPPGLPSFEHVAIPSLARGTAPWLRRKIAQKLGGTDLLLERALASRRIDVLSHSGHLGRRARLPTLAWIPDFQHRRVPEYFQPRELEVRERFYAEQCAYATRVVVSSHTAKKDLAELFPAAASKARVLQFVANVPDPSALPSREALARKYDCAEPYFFLPNQFWAHKNHAVVIEALALLKARGTPVRVLATGNTEDHRQPEHFRRLMDRAAELGLQRAFQPLGLVPYEDLMALMRHSAAVLNPSKFEGWSTSVEEAKSMGKPVIASDIEVHREQAPDGCAYFEPDDAGALAERMQEMLLAARDTDEMPAAARSKLGERRAGFARRFEEIVLECLC